MANIRPFQCIRPNETVASRVAALPYDVYNRAEAKAEVEKEPLSFLKIDRAETQFDDSVDMYDTRVYQKAKDLLEENIRAGIFKEDKQECYFIYELIMKGRAQTGLVACASIDDYLNKVIKEHEKTREDKELDRIRHVDTCSAQTGPIFLAYRSNSKINAVIDEVKRSTPLYGFTAVDGITHNVWRIDGLDRIGIIQQEFNAIGNIYIADGHHRAASAVKVGLKRRESCEEYDGTEEFNYFYRCYFRKTS